jgi:hypothetical protein
MNYAFLNQDGVVVQAITGSLSAEQQAQFLHDYGLLFGASSVVEVAPDVIVWIGGLYSDGQFIPPTVPELEPQPEPLPEPQPETEPEPEPEV